MVFRCIYLCLSFSPRFVVTLTGAGDVGKGDVGDIGKGVVKVEHVDIGSLEGKRKGIAESALGSGRLGPEPSQEECETKAWH